MVFASAEVHSTLLVLDEGVQRILALLNTVNVDPEEQTIADMDSGYQVLAAIRASGRPTNGLIRKLVKMTLPQVLFD